MTYKLIDQDGVDEIVLLSEKYDFKIKDKLMHKLLQLISEKESKTIICRTLINWIDENMSDEDKGAFNSQTLLTSHNACNGN